MDTIIKTTSIIYILITRNAQLFFNNLPTQKNLNAFGKCRYFLL